MLKQFYRILIVNNTGETVTFNSNGRLNLKVTAWFIDPSTGKITYTQDADDDFAFIAGDTLIDGGFEESSEIVNTSDKFLGAQIQIEVTHDAGTAANGTVDVYVATGDATGELDSDASGFDDPETNKLDFLGSLTWPSAGADDEVVRSWTIEI